MKREAFFDLAARLTQRLQAGEVLFCNLDGEDSDFVRLNGNRIRQAGSLCRRTLELSLITGRRQVTGGLRVGGEPGAGHGLAKGSAAADARSAAARAGGSLPELLHRAHLRRTYPRQQACRMPARRYPS